MGKRKCYGFVAIFFLTERKNKSYSLQGFILTSLDAASEHITNWAIIKVWLSGALWFRDWLPYVTAFWDHSFSHSTAFTGWIKRATVSSDWLSGLDVFSDWRWGATEFKNLLSGHLYLQTNVKYSCVWRLTLKLTCDWRLLLVNMYRHTKANYYSWEWPSF